MNVTVFSLKNEKGLYAFSINKKYIDLFKLQRNMDLFYIHNVKMDKYEFMAFSNNNNSKMLISDVLYDSETNSNIDIITTVEESDSLTESCKVRIQSKILFSSGITIIFAGHYPK